MVEMFIKFIKFDEEKRIIVSVQDHLAEYLVKDETKKQLKDMLVQALGDKFVKLEVAKTSCRATVKEGTEEECKTIIEAEIKKAIDMAMSFMSQMDQGGKEEK